MSERMVNGVNVDALFKTVEMIKGNPEIAKFTFRAKNRWIDGAHNRAMVMDFSQAGQMSNTRKEFRTYELDEPEVLLGMDIGPNPVEYVLVALSGCLTTSLVANAAARGIQLNSVESDFEGDLDVRGFFGMDENIRNGYQEIRVTFKIESDEPDDKLRELVQIAQQRSPVFDIVTNKVPVSVSFERLK